MLINKFSHVQIEETDTTINKEEKLNIYKSRIDSFPGYFEKLVIQIFRQAIFILKTGPYGHPLGIG